MASNTCQVCQRVDTQQTDLFRKMDKMLFAGICAGTGLEKGANGEEGQEDFEDCTTWVVLVGRLDIASDDMRSRYFIKNGLCLYKSKR